MKSLWPTVSFAKPLELLLQALAFAFLQTLAFADAVASSYPKASALGLAGPHEQRGFIPWGMLSSRCHNFQSAEAQ
jgi:hypothetical protein